MARYRFRRLRFLVVVFAVVLFSRQCACDDEFSITDLDWSVFHQDYSPPAPPPPPPHPPSVSCVDDLGGVGTLDTTCKITEDANLTRGVYIAGEGNFNILPGVRFHCEIPGCWITVNVTGNFSLGSNASIVTGAFELESEYAVFENGSVVNTTCMAGDPPPQTSGTPQGVDGGGGGYGGRGAGCLVDTKKLPEDVWGGDAYSWSSLQNPSSFGSRGASTSKESEYGGLGGGVVRLTIHQIVEMNASLLAEGGDGGNKGGGGSGGSIYIKAYRM